MATRMSTTKAIKKVQMHLASHALNGAEVSIYFWHDQIPEISKRPLAGIRVAEVSFSVGLSGASFMQSDPDGLAVCAQVERCIIAYAEGWPITEIEYALDLLDFMFQPKEGQKE